MRSYATLIVGLQFLIFFPAALPAEVRVVSERNDNATATSDFTFKDVPPPSRTDAATTASLTLLSGRADVNGGDLKTLHDGRVPMDKDDPAENFFFAAGTPGGRLLIDLGAITEIRRINTYSWHPSTRGPQVYQLYAADGKNVHFDSRPKPDADPGTCGWTRIADVNTRPQQGNGGGQYGVSIAGTDGIVGDYRYLLFDISRTEATDPFGNTFFSEIDVDDGTVHQAETTAAPELRRETIAIDGGRYQITIDTTESPDLTQWAHEELAEVVREWYPKIITMLPSDGYEAPRMITITFSDRISGVAATSGARVQCSGNWMRQNLQGEAKGAVVHELVHVVQQYGRLRRDVPGASRPPGWLVEGIADYIRWFLYEPESRGAEITPRNIARARYDASYRISANFLNWVTTTHDNQIVAKLNAAMREGRYREELWREYTGHDVRELAEMWTESLKNPRDVDTSGSEDKKE